MWLVQISPVSRPMLPIYRGGDAAQDRISMLALDRRDFLEVERDFKN